MNLATGETRRPVPPVTRAAPEGRREFKNSSHIYPADCPQICPSTRAQFPPITIRICSSV